MARLVTSGFELQKAVAAYEGEAMVIGGGTPTIDTTTKRSGAAALKSPSGAGHYVGWTLTGVNGTDYFLRTYVNFSVAPTVVGNVASFWSGVAAKNAARIRTTAGGGITCVDNALTLIGGTFAITANTWYRVEVRVRTVADLGTTQQIEWFVDGVSQGSSSAAAGTGPVTNAYVGAHTNVGADVYSDDVAVNDSTGAAQTSWPGDGKVVLLKPVADSSRAGFTAGAGATTALWDAVDNTPPSGVVVGSATNTSQIKDSVSNTTDNYVAQLAEYTDPVASGGGGLHSGDQVTVAQALVRAGNSSTTSRNVGIQSVSNPVIAETTGALGTTAAGTDPTGWTTLRTAYSYAPVVTLGAGPTVEVRKATASTDNMMAEAMGLLVEYLPGARRSLAVPPRAARNSLLRR